MITFPFHVLPLLLLGQADLTGDRYDDALNAGASWASAGIPARCMLTMFANNDQPVPKSPEAREAARLKAQIIAGLTLEQLRISDEFYRLTQIYEKSYIDYYENGLMSEEEYNEKVVERAQAYRDMVASTADHMIKYKECNFFRGRENSETVRRAMRLIQTRTIE